MRASDQPFKIAKGTVLTTILKVGNDFMEYAVKLDEDVVVEIPRVDFTTMARCVVDAVWCDCNVYVRVPNDQPIPAGSIHKLGDGPLCPLVHPEETVGQYPTDFSADRSFYAPYVPKTIKAEEVVLQLE